MSNKKKNTIKNIEFVIPRLTKQERKENVERVIAAMRATQANRGKI
jgi:hypothetical protein